MPTVNAFKIRENLVRRVAARRGLRLIKSRRRDKKAIDFERYALEDPHRKTIVFGAKGGRYVASLDDIKAHLDEG